MATCSHTSNCALFPMISVNSALKVWRTFYCEGKWHECARYKLSLEGKPVPPNLLPNGKMLDMGITETAAESKPVAPAEKLGASFDDELNDIEKDIASITGKPASLKTPTAPTAPATSTAPKPAATGPTASYYLRMQIQPATGVMSEIIRTLGEQRVRIDAVTEKKAYAPDAPSYLIVLTDQTVRGTIDEAVSALAKLASIIGDIKVIELEAMKDGQLV